MAYRRGMHGVLAWLLAAAPPPPDLPIPQSRTGPVIAALLAIAVVGLGVILVTAQRIAAAGRRRLSRGAGARATDQRRRR